MLRLATAIIMIASALVAAAPSLQLSNNRLKLDVDLALDGGKCELHDLATGETWSAVDFGVIRAWDNTEDRMRTLLISPDTKTSQCKVTIDKADETHAVIRVDTGAGSASAMGTMSFGVAFDIALSLEGNTLEYAIPIASLREQAGSETIPQRWRLMNVELFPHLGATPAGSPGCLLIPSWCGAVYYFDRNNPRANPEFAKPGYGDLGMQAGLTTRWNFRPDAPAEYGSLVYGVQAAWEDQLQQPTYATFRENGGLMGLLMSGEYDAELRARRNQGPQRTASINPIWHYRHRWNSKLDRVDRRGRLIALTREQTNFCSVGNIFRDYLIHERGVKTLRERAATHPELAYLMDSIYLRVMMGMKQSSLDGKGPMRSFQSWDNFTKAIDLFQQAGFKKINFIFVGANYQGHDGAHPTVFPIEPAHGGDEAFARLIARVEKADYRMGLHMNYKDTYRCSPDWTPEAVQINEYGELRYHGAWIGGYSYQAIPQEMLERFGKRDLPKLRALGLHGMHYWDACLSVMEETFPPHRVITRREYGEGARAYMQYAADVFGCVGCETSLAMLLGTIANVGNVSYPFGGGPGKFTFNGYCEAALIDHWVPLQHVIYHGLCTYQGGAEVLGRPGYEFNATPTQEEIDKIRARYLEQQKWGGKLDYEFITSYDRPAPAVIRIGLSDGTAVWINRGKDGYQGQGITLEPHAISVIHGK